MAVNRYLTLNNGIKIPQIGFGTFRMEDGNVVIGAVENALKYDYRHIDTAAVYDNEEGVGIAIKKNIIARDILFITTKLWNTYQGYDTTLKAFDESLKKLKLEYIDLYLIHWPCVKNVDWEQKNYDTWRAFERLYEDGKIKSIGVSNFKEKHLQPLLDKAKIVPLVNQLELNPSHQQKEVVEFCKKYNIICEAWGPLMQGKNLNNQVLVDIATKYHKNVAQILIRWSVQKGFVPLPKSITPERIKLNLDVFEFNLTDEDMNELDKLDGNVNYSGLDPDEVQF
jgi:diketogulonate reductase-like aldo/keto reductase